MKKYFYIISSSLLIIGGSFFSQAHVSADSFNPAHILDDSVMQSSSSMTPSQIQDFLSSKVPNCDTNGTQPASDFGRPDLTHAQYAAMRGWAAPPYVCLRDYNVNGLTAAQMIYNVSQQYHINPQVLIVTLQKESSLVTDTWPLPSQYQAATGYGCPDSGPNNSANCNSSYYGLSNQLTQTGYMYHAIMTQNPNWYSPYVVGTNYIQYNPQASCGGTNVTIVNWATAALYDYTPYQPNQAALNAGWGTGDSCSAYGNRNFWLYFNAWFGSPTIPPVYAWTPASQNVYQDSARTIAYPYSPTVAPGQKFYVTIFAKNTGNQIWYNSSMRLATSNPQDRSSAFYSSDWLSNNRVSNLSEPSVAPGASGTFKMTLTAPQQPGQYKEYFSLVDEGVTWLNDPGLYIPITVTPARTLSFYGDAGRTNKLAANPTLYTGSKVYATLNLTNNTAAAWPTNTTLGTTNPNDRLSPLVDSSWISSNRVATLGGNTPLNPGQAGSINFTLNIPSTPATYNESYGLVVDGSNGYWIENNTANFTLTSVARPPDILANSPGIALNSGQGLVSSNGQYRLAMQSDGNLVIYSPNRAVWASNTVGSGGNALVMQSDGNLVIYSPNRAVWASNTVGSGGNALVMQSDGNLVIYSPNRAVWASNTAGKS